MKKTFQIIVLLTLTCFSFFVTEQSITVIKEQDSLMIKLNEIKDKYKTDPINAIIGGNTIIPGINGKEINIHKSYSYLKKIGYFDEKLLIYKDISPDISINDNYSKYIIKGNNLKNKISLIFVLNDDSDLEKINSITKDTKVNYFVDVEYLNNNLKNIKKISQNSEIYNYGYNGNYSESLLIFGNNLIERNSNNKASFCLTKEYNETLLKICSSQKNHVILPNIITKKNPYNEIKNNIVNGSIILIELNNTTINELPTIINFINSKGYKIVLLGDLLNESLN